MGASGADWNHRSAPPREVPPLDTASPALRPPKQDRSRRTLARIVRAALELIAEQGVDATGVKQIVARADSSVGSFYARFDGKEALLRHLEARVWADATERWRDAVDADAWRQLTLQQLLEGLARLVIDTWRTDEAQRRALAARTGHGATTGEAADFMRRVRRDVRGLLLERTREMDHPEPGLAVDVVLGVLLGTARELVAEGPAGPLRDLQEARHVRELGRMLAGYLQGRSEISEEDEPPVEFFDVWG